MGNLVPRPKGEVEKVEITREQALAVYNAGEDMMKDIQLAMALLKRYQRNLSMLGAPDPDIVEARNLMRKHGEAYQGRADTFRIFAGGVDITEHPDSIPGQAEEIVDEAELLIEDAEVVESVEVFELSPGRICEFCEKEEGTGLVGVEPRPEDCPGPFGHNWVERD